jgi:TonB family protein
MKYTYFLILILSQSIFSFGQQIDTVYFKDSGHRKVTTKEKAKVYEIRSLRDGIETKAMYSLPANELVLITMHNGDMPTGRWEDYRSKGRQVIKDYRFELRYSGQRIEGGIYPALDKNENIESAFFPGGIENFYEYVGGNLRYPSYARRYGIQGDVKVHVKVTKTGKVEYLSIFEGTNKFLDQEAVRVIIQCPNWEPAKLKGEPVDSYYILSITFKLA